MEIKATQIKNSQVQESASSVRLPAKIGAENNSFIDEMLNLPKLDAGNTAPQNLVSNKQVAENSDRDSKLFEFVSKGANDFSSIMKKDKLSFAEKQEMHKAAEKELVNEIVLMNSKQNAGAKDVVKNELTNAQASVANKSENQIKDEKQEIQSEFKNFDNFELKESFENVEFKAPDKLEQICNVENELVLPENFAVEEIIGEPENLQKFEEPVISQFEKVELPESLEVSEVIIEEPKVPQAEVKSEPQIAKVSDVKVEEPKVSQAEIKSEPQIAKVSDVKVEEPKVPQAEIKSEPQIAKVSDVKVEEPKAPQAEIKSEPQIAKVTDVKADEPKVSKAEVKSEPQIAKVADVKVEEPKVSHAEVKSEPQIAKVSEVKVEEPKVLQPLQNKQTKVNKQEDVKTGEDFTKVSKALDIDQPKQVTDKDIIDVVTNDKNIQKPIFKENIPNLEKVAEKSAKISDKPSVQNISKKKPEIFNEVDNIGKVKDISDDIKVKAVDVKPVVPEDIKVIKMEVINPLAEINKSFDTAKTSDIVKFIDANLSTESAKKSKTTASKATDAAKKASAEKAIKMTEADAKFFNNLIETNQQVIEGSKTSEQNLNNTFLKDVETAQASQVSKTLLNALKESQESNKAFRVDFDKDISVILRVSKNGQISAEFLPGDEAVEQYLKANIPLLKQKFSEEGLEYDNLSYRQNRKDNEDRNRQSRGNKKENGYE